jgi:hypothetical protein
MKKPERIIWLEKIAFMFIFAALPILVIAAVVIFSNL